MCCGEKADARRAAGDGGAFQEHHRFSQRRACRLVQRHRATIRYHARPAAQDGVRERLRALAAERPRFGYRRLAVLLRRELGAVNHKRVYRLYRQEGLAVRRRQQADRLAARPVSAAPQRAGEQWAMDFTQDVLANGRAFRTLHIVDLCTRECLAIEVDTSLPGARVARVLDRLCERHGRPTTIRVDNGPEFAGQVLDAWAYQHGCDWTSSSRGGRCRTATWSASTASSATSASTSTGSSASPRAAAHRGLAGR